MADFKAGEKRKHTEQEERDCSKQKIVEERTMESANPMKITDINQFCLEHIFMYLDLEALLDVADANNQLKIATYTVFARKYASRYITIQYERTRSYTTSKFRFLANIKVVNTDSLKRSFQMLRCFGHMIKDLSIEYCDSYSFRVYHRIENYLNEFCSNSLIKLTIVPVFQPFTSIFPNIEELDICQHRGLLQENCLNKKFPKLRRLRFSTQKDIKIAFHHFPNLHHLEFSPYISSDLEADVKTILCLNPQLRSFKIWVFNIRFIQNISDHLQSLDTLDIGINVEVGTEAEAILSNSNPIYLPNVRNFALKFSMNAIAPIPNIPFFFKQLNEFRLEFDLIGEYSQFFRKFISENPSIEKLSLRGIDLLELTKVQDILPSLKEIRYRKAMENIEEVISLFSFLKNYKPLLSFTFNARRHLDSKINEICANTWRVKRVPHPRLPNCSDLILENVNFVKETR